MKKIIVLFLVCMMLFMTLNISALAAAPRNDNSYEVVLVIDTSGSMNTSDPANSDKTRISTEAMESFALKCSQSGNESFKLSVVIYNTKVHTLVKNLDITTEAGKSEYKTAIQNLNTNNVYNEDGTKFTCWAGQTNIGLAMQAAKEILDDSGATKKAVMLFTDGRIELPTSAQIQESERLAQESSQSFRTDEIPLFCVGLNKSNTVNESFLESLSNGTGSAEFPGRTEICTDASKLKTLFDDVYAFFSGSVNEEEPPVYIPSTIPYKKSIYIYDNAISSLTISLNCDHKLKTVKITDPNGNVVVNANITSGAINYDETRCSYDATISQRNIIITLHSPVGGEWEISLASEVTTAVTISKIAANDLTVKAQSSQNVLAGTSFTCDVALWNKTKNEKIEDLKIYSDSECKATIEDSNGNKIKDVTFNLNGAKNGYAANIDGLAPGTYTIKFNVSNSSIGNSPFNVASEITVCAVEPKITITGEGSNLTISLVDPLTNQKISTIPAYLIGKSAIVKIYKNNTVVDQKEIPLNSFTNGTYSMTISGDYGDGDFYCIASVNNTIVSDKHNLDFVSPAIKVESNGSDFEVGKNVSLTVTLYDNKTSQVYTTIPANLAGKTVLIKVYKDGAVVNEKNIPVSDFVNGIYTHNVAFDVAGDFECTAEIVGENIVAPSINFKTVNRPVKVVTEPADINVEIDLKKTNVFNYQFKLDDLFYDGDGHTLTYEVNVDGNNIAYEIKNGILYITVTEITEAVNGKITVTASDGYGSSASVTTDLNLSIVVPREPLDPGVIIMIIVIIAVILLIAAVVAVIVIYIKSKINVKFSIRLSVVDEDENVHEAVYNVYRKPALVRGTGPKLSVKDVIARCSTLSGSTEPEDGRMLDSKLLLLNDVYVMGVPFKNTIKLFDNRNRRVCTLRSVASLNHRTKDGNIKIEIAKFENWEPRDDE